MSKALTELTTELEATIKQFEQKYGMAFEAYKRIWETEEREEDYSYEREQDFLEWEALVTRYARLEFSFAWMP